ncbi:MAG: hypothetical protein CGW95_06615, partial [Phenylobacterium zucineum]
MLDMPVLIAALALAQAVDKTPAVVWTLEIPKAAPALFTYADGGNPIVQMVCQTASGQVGFKVALQTRLATQKTGAAWTNSLGMPAPWPASVTLKSDSLASTLRGMVDADQVTGASQALVEASTQAPVLK